MTRRAAQLHDDNCGTRRCSTSLSDTPILTDTSILWPHVSVVIPAYNCAAHIKGCLASVYAQTYQGQMDVTIALAPSTDGTQQILSDIVASDIVAQTRHTHQTQQTRHTPGRDTAHTHTPRQDTAHTHTSISVVDNPKGTTSAGLNTAIENSSGEIVVRVDAQSRIPANYVQQAVMTIMKSGAANVGGVQHPTVSTDRGVAASIAAALASPLGGGPASYRRHSYRQPTARHQPTIRKQQTVRKQTARMCGNANEAAATKTTKAGYVDAKAGPVDTVYLGVFKRDALLEVGGFDESLERNQDYELNWRLRKAGHIVWLDPELVVDYIPRSNFGDLATQYFRYGTWKRAMLLRNPRSVRLRQLAPVALLAALMCSAYDLLRGKPRGAVIPMIYTTACLVATRRMRSTLARRQDCVMSAVACVVIHISWATGFLVGKTRPQQR